MGSKSPRARLPKEQPETPAIKTAFLAAYRESGFVLQASQKVGVPYRLIYKWLEYDKQFAAEYEVVNQHITERCESAALHRAVNGVEVPLMYKGQKCYETVEQIQPDGTKKKVQKLIVTREYSDRLLELILKARDRKKYGEKVEMNVDEDAIANQIAARFVSIVRRVAPDVCPGCKTRLDLSQKIAEELLSLSSKVTA